MKIHEEVEMNRNRRFGFPKILDVLILFIAISFGIVLHKLVQFEIDPRIPVIGGILYGVVVGVVSKASPELRSFADIFDETGSIRKISNVLNYLILVAVSVLVPYGILCLINDIAFQSWEIFLGVSAVLLVIQFVATSLQSDAGKKWMR